MINHLRHMSVFAKVVDEGSFRAAANTLGLAPSRVSQTVSDLEKYLGVSLLNRTTRKLFLTNEGRKLYIHAAEITRSAEAGINELNIYSQQPIGSLKVSMPAFLTSSSISGAIAKFAQQYPTVSLSLHYTDQVVDILNEEIDLSIRVGWLKDSSLMCRKLGESQRLLVAGPKYVMSQPIPKHPTDLKDWNWIRFSMRPNTVDFTSRAGEEVSVSETSNISVNSADALWYFASQNLGLTILPEPVAREQIKSGELVNVLPEWQLKPLGYYAVWPDKSRRETLTLLLVRFLAEHDI
ncbi:LysR family transcriptional regulator [Shewanella frigidimarina]|uniref:Transcriptional regulator n=1 Tax=Shewanella frigidimarina TaxID=56812 RepID=A0A106BYY4_SHEFR|nr:LysR family transcriptional regulator [Shewanella frigidimarina]KVX01182.1 transcriptional regulator [Shewanella frigidimarina]